MPSDSDRQVPEFTCFHSRFQNGFHNASHLSVSFPRGLEFLGTREIFTQQKRRLVSRIDDCPADALPIANRHSLWIAPVSPLQSLPRARGFPASTPGTTRPWNQSVDIAHPMRPLVLSFVRGDIWWNRSTDYTVHRLFTRGPRYRF